MSIRRLVILALGLCGSCSLAWAQSSYQVGVLPAINLNYKFESGWSVNLKTESRQSFITGTFNGDRNNTYDYVLTDQLLIAARKVGLNSRISGGYQFRIRERRTFHRFIQQFSATQQLSFFRLAHRVVTDQTISASEATAYRLRYRLATEIPLNGQSADVREFYFKIGNEYLNILQDGDYDLEVRLVPLLGYTFADNHKVEFGLDYRVNSFLKDAPSHRFWGSLNWYIEM